MPALNFRKQFTTSILNGDKRHTVRALRKHPIKEGETLYLYTGMRTRGKARLLRKVICTGVASIFIDEHTLVIDGQKKDTMARLIFALQDGFWGWGEFVLTLQEMHEFPFEGQVIYW